MISALFIIQIMLLVIGFSVGYWFLITASKQEERLKIIGEILGWIIIVGTIFLLICNFFLSIMIVNNFNSSAYCFIQTHMQEKPSVNQGTQGDQSEMPLVPQNK